MTADPRLAEVFNRVCDELEAVHGEARLRTLGPVGRFGEAPFMTAGWFLNLANNGFKIYDHGEFGVEIVTWAHAGDLDSARVRLRSWDAVEAILRAVLPPALSPLDRAVFAPLSEPSARETAGDAAVSPVADVAASATPRAAEPGVSAARPSTPTGCPRTPGVDGHHTPADSPGGGT